MALLTAEDVLNKKFQATKFREGYDQDEVDDFLDDVVNTLRAVEGENDELKTKLSAAERRIAELSRAGAQDSSSAPSSAAPTESAPAKVEAPAAPTPPVAAAVVAPPAPMVSSRASDSESATGMLALAQKLHDDYVRSGQEEGDRIIAEAKTQGTRITREAEETSSRTLTQLEQERSLLERKIDELRVFERDYRTRLKSYLENLLGDLDTRGSALPPHGGQSVGADAGGL